MKTLLFASLLSMSCVAAAEPARAPARPAGGDKTSAIFEEDQLPEGSADVDRFTLALFPDGTVERTDRKHGGAETHATGRIDHKQVAEIKATLAKATWKVTINDIHCMAIGQTFTRFAVDGRNVFDQHVCGDHVLDAESQQALADARAIVEGAVPTATPPPPPVPQPTGPAPAACTRGGALFGEAQLLESNKGTGAWDTYELTVFEGGAWERVDHKKTGGEGRSNGCLDAAQVKTIRDALATATWQSPEQGIHCMAIGVTFTRFTVRGKVVFDQHVCGNGLDANSGKALATVRDIVDKAAAPHTPPCCKN